MRLTSTAFTEGERIPSRYTCDGENESPPLAWTGAPKEAKSFVLLCEDPDAPGGTWHHWAAYDIPVSVKSLAAGLEFNSAINDFRRPGYGGPCPPPGHGAHRYYFSILALSIAELALRKNPTCKDVEAAARKHMIAEARLCGTYER